MTTLKGSRGLPFLGETSDLFQHTYAFGKTHVRRYGDVFSTRYLGSVPAVVLASAEGQRFVLAEQPEKFSWAMGYGLGKDLFGDALFMVDGTLHDTQRAIMTPAFAGAAYAGYLRDMNMVISERLDTWGTRGTLPFYNEARAIAFTLASTFLAGVDASFDRQRFQRLFTQLIRGASAFVRLPIPLTKYGQALQARRQIDEVLIRLIAARRVQPTQDALGLLVDAKDAHGQGFTDAQLRGLAVTIIFAGSDSTASALSFLLAELLQRPELYEQVRAMVGQGTEPVTQEDFRHRPLLDALIEETLRLHPATPVIMRGAVESSSFAGYEIPAGYRVFLIPAYTQRRPDYFVDPDRFDPERFLRNEDQEHPYAHIPFGGGKRNCLGSGIAKLELKTLIMLLFRRFDLKLVSGQDFSPLGLPQNRPRSAVQIVFSARTQG